METGTSSLKGKVSSAPFIPSISKECVESLKDLGVLLENDLAWLSRTLGDEGKRITYLNKDSLQPNKPENIETINPRRRAARSFLVHLFKGQVDQTFFEDLKQIWLPTMLGKEASESKEKVTRFLEFARGLIAGALHFEPRENLVPMVIMQNALNQVFESMAVYLGLRG